MSPAIPVGTTPATIKTLCVRMYEATTGRPWRDRDVHERTTWLTETEPLVRWEEGIAADAVWQDGAWIPAGQGDLFGDLSPTDADSEATA